jgi:AraC-like DNA-binding protein
MKEYESIEETLLFYGVKVCEPYYISTGKENLKFPERPFRMDFYAFCICISGYIDLEIDNKKFTVSQNGFLVSAPSTVVRFLSHSKNFRMKLLFFDKNFLLKNISNPFFIEGLNLFSDSNFTVTSSDKEQSTRLILLLQYLEQQTERKNHRLKDVIRTIIINLLLEISIVIETENKQSIKNALSDPNNIYQKFKNLVQENVLSHRGVQFYAEKLYISSKHLIEIIKKHSGKTPHVMIDETLIKITYVLLGNPEKTISEIAFELGFSSTSAFGRFFKKQVGISPQEFRNQLAIKK